MVKVGGVSSPLGHRRIPPRERVRPMPVSVNLSIAEVEELDDSAVANGLTRSDAIRRGINMWFASQAKE